MHLSHTVLFSVSSENLFSPEQIDNLKNSNNEKKKKKKNDNIKGNRHHYRHKFVIFLRVISKST